MEEWERAEGLYCRISSRVWTGHDGESPERCCRSSFLFSYAFFSTHNGNATKRHLDMRCTCSARVWWGLRVLVKVDSFFKQSNIAIKYQISIKCVCVGARMSDLVWRAGDAGDNEGCPGPVFRLRHIHEDG